MSGDKVMEKKQEPTIEVSENSTKETGATPIIEKSVTPPVKEYDPWLPYPSRLKSDHTNEQFK